MTGPTDMLVDTMTKQLSELINSSLILNLKIPLQVYQLQNKEHCFYRSESAPAPSSKETKLSSDSELVLLKFF